MYWMGKDGVIEFANVGPKREEFIHDRIEACAASGAL
jgi:hypothetical protein